MDCRCQEGQATPVERCSRVNRLSLSRLAFRFSSIFWGAFAPLFHAPFYHLSEWPLSLVDPILLQTNKTRSALNPSRKLGIDNNQVVIQMHLPLHIISAFFSPQWYSCGNFLFSVLPQWSVLEWRK
jgi:hypothetical protein